MAFAVSEGNLHAVHKPVYQAPSSIRLSDDLTEDYAAIYRKQPAVRTVVDFLARNVAQLSIHTFRRIQDTDRERLRDHPLAMLLSNPNPYTTAYRLIHGLVSDRGIYDRALWVKLKGEALVRIPPRLWSIADDENWLNPSTFIIKGSKGKFAIPAANVVYFRGYNPEDERYGLSPIESLRRALSEEYAAGQMREQILRNGARHSGYISRPKDAPTWSDTARQRFRAGWRGQYQGWSATDAGGTPILEDGMTFTPASQSAVDLQYVESRKLTREEVAAAYFIPPPMIGMLDNASFSNITEQHKMLYQDTLGPLLMEIKQEIELQILPDFEDTDGVYVEFNMQEKLRGSFEEQAAQLQTSVGAPYLTRNEARARANLPRVEGGDELVVPLNVLIGGQASPTDSAPDGALSWRPPLKQAGPLALKAKPDTTHVEKARQVLAGFFKRQGAAVRSAIGAGRDDWWDGKRWDDELAADLFALSAMVSTAVGRKQLDRLGVDPDDYDEDRTLEYLNVAARSNAESINSATRIRLDEALAGDDPLEAAAHVFEVAETSRAVQAAGTITTALAGFASVEAVRQVGGGRKVTKTWIVTSSNPRPSHASMHGETVDLDDTFSNGARWPGDSSALDVDEVAGCSCDVQIDFG
ncbi:MULTISPECIES: phage portal protein [unclassified Microbacterium]|uniref:phage portal protein n=1 Tax=Microbacterium TaxID=33882 RepID=UPI003B9ED480